MSANKTVDPRLSKQVRLPGNLANELFQAGTHLTQARGIIHTVIELKPKAGELNGGEIAQALYAAVDQINKAIAVVDATDFETAVKS